MHGIQTSRKRTIQWTYLLSSLNVDLTANDLLPTYLLGFADSNGSFTALEAFCEYSFSCARACKNMSHGSRAPLYLPLATSAQTFGGRRVHTVKSIRVLVVTRSLLETLHMRT